MFPNYATVIPTYISQEGSTDGYQTFEVHTESSFSSQEADTNAASMAVNEYPRLSAITVTHGSGEGILSGTRQERANFVDLLPTRVQVKLNQPFGKDNLTQCFKAEACFRHVLLPLYKSAFLE